MKDEKDQDNEEENKLSFYDVMLEAIKLGLMPRTI